MRPGDSRPSPAESPDVGREAAGDDCETGSEEEAPPDRGNCPGDGASPRGDRKPGLDTHGALRPFDDAARLAAVRIVVLRMQARAPAGALRWRPVVTAWKAMSFWDAHRRLAVGVWRARRSDLIVVREFLTAFLAAVWPFIWPLRRRVCFVVNHNLQEAHRRRFERTLLRLLSRSGARLVCFESPAGFEEIGLRTGNGRILTVRHPLPAVSAPRPPAPGAPPVVGLVGSARAEKSVDPVLRRLIALRQSGRVGMQLVLGCPEERLRAAWAAQGIQVVDTTSRDAYVQTLRNCDVVVLNYRPERYYYRPSGVIADAVAHGAAVVCPDFPLLRRQVTDPAPVGAVFRDLDDLERALAEAIALRMSAPDSWRAQGQMRGARVLAARLEEFAREGRAHPDARMRRGEEG